KSDKNSVDRTWWPVFEKFEAAGGGTNGSEAPASKPAPAAQQAPSAKQAPAAAAQKGSPQQVTPTTTPAPAKSAGAKDTTTDRGVTPATAEEETVKAESKSAGASNLPTRNKGQAEDVEDVVTKLRGPAKLIASNMDDSLTVPTATSVRALPAKALIDNRIVINSHLKRTRGGKVSFTHIIAYAMVRALREFPSQNVYYDVQDGKPVMVQPGHVNLGIAIDVPKKDGSRTLLVPNIKKAETLS